MNVASFIVLQKDFSESLLSQLVQADSNLFYSRQIFDCFEEVFNLSFNLIWGLLWACKTKFNKLELIVFAEVYRLNVLRSQ